MTSAEPAYRVVVAVGFTPECVQTVREALSLATRVPGVELHITTVIDRLDAAGEPTPVPGYADLLDTELRLVSFTRDVASAMPELPTTLGLVFHVRVGPIAVTLLQVAFDVDAGFVVVGSRAPSRATRMIVGTVADALIREGRYPVLIAREPNVEGLVRTLPPAPRRPGQASSPPLDAMLRSVARLYFGAARTGDAGDG